MLEEAKSYIKKNEGQVVAGGRHMAYDDACGKPCKKGDKIEGYLTIGYGRNVMGRGLSQDEADYLLENDVEEVYEELRAKYPWFASLSPNRQIAMIDLRFNLGAAKLSTFVKFLEGMANGHYINASAEILLSAYAKQVGPRALKNSELIRNG